MEIRDRTASLFCLDLIQFFQPQSVTGIAWHTPVGAGAEGDGTDLRSIRQAAALELLGKEPAVEVAQPGQQHFRLIPPGKCGQRQVINLGGSKPKAQHIIQVKIMQLIRPNQLFGLLGNGAIRGGGQQLRAD